MKGCLFWIIFFALMITVSFLEHGDISDFIIIVGAIAVFALFIFLKGVIWDKPRDEVLRLKREIEAINKRREEEIQEKIQTACADHIDKIELLKQENKKLQKEKESFQQLFEKFKSNLTAIPYMAGIISDIETIGLEKLAFGLDWGRSQKRLDKVKSIREIRKDAKAMVEKNKEAQYQLAYLMELFPNLEDVIECEFNSLPAVEVSELSERDATRDYLSKEEYRTLTVTERNQLALDRYNNSHNKTKWQIGRDYEQYVGYQYRKKGYDVDDFGSYMGMEDLGRDIIAKKENNVLIIQCKYWSSIKQIHEKHVTQLYGTMISYCIENNVEQENVKGVLITNIQLSEMAKKMASYLGIQYVENYEMGAYPCIKCNIGHGVDGETRIYHLPFDQQYDATKIKKKGEFYAMTVAEAEAAGFRRTYKWFGNR